MKKYSLALVLIIIGLAIGGGAVYLQNQSKRTSSTMQNGSINQSSPTIGVEQNQGINRTVSPTGAITLTISSPVNGTTVTAASVVVKGKTVPRGEVFANDSTVTANGNGDFSVQVPLDEGENTIIVVANDADGNSAETELTVTYESGK